MNSEAVPLNRRILIVDDTAAIHADFRKLLSAPSDTATHLAAAAAAFLGTAPAPAAPETFDLTSAYQGNEALQRVQDSIAQARPFALAFMDIRMPPGWDGIETTAQLWAVDPDLHIVLCTAYSDYSWEEIVARLGNSDRLLILKKPFDRMEVLQLAKTLTEKWRLARQWHQRMDTLDRLVDRRTEELRAANQQLTAEIAERERAQAARGQLEAQLRQSQRLEAIGQLAGGVAHDFNNLLAVIRGNVELVCMDEANLRTEQRDCLGQVVTAADRAANLTRQLLAFSRKQVMQSQPLDLNQVVANLTKMLKRVIGEDIDLECRYAAQTPRAMADIAMLEQVLINLVVNARDAMPKGGHLVLSTECIALAEDKGRARSPSAPLRTPPPHPEARAGEFACLTVQDTGTGIAPEHLSRIFEPFFTTKELGKGTGLGLATVYGIVQQHQGWIEVTSELGQGSTFRVFLPALKTAAPAAAEATPEPTPRGGSETILLVEDDEAVRSLTRRVLDSCGYHVCEAASGREALDRWSETGSRIDLLLTDMIMPEGLSGRDLAEQLMAQRPDLKVVFMSGYSGDTVRKDPGFLQRTNSRFLQKPCSARTLLQAIRQRLDENQPATPDYV